MVTTKYSLRPPFLDFRKIPDKEADAADEIRTSLNQLAQYIDDFVAALTLIEHCEAIHRNSKKSGGNADITFAWSQIAARDGAMTLYHVRECMVVVTTLLRKTTTTKTLVDTSALETHKGRYRAAFPFETRMRHSIAHSATRLSTRERAGNHRVQGPVEIPGVQIGKNASVTISGALIERQYILTHGKEVISYTLDMQSLSKLRGIVGDFFSAFRRLENEWSAPLK